MELAIFVIGLLLFLFVLSQFVPFVLLKKAIASGVEATPMMMIGMRMRGVDQKAVVEPVIKARQKGIIIKLEIAEAHYLANGDLTNLVDGLLLAKENNIETDFQKLAAIDLTGRNVVEAVKQCVNPQVLQHNIKATAGDGKELKLKALVTVKHNLNRLVGGADSDFLLKQIGEVMKRGVEGEEDSRAIIQNANELAEKTMKLGLDSSTAYHLLDISLTIE